MSSTAITSQGLTIEVDTSTPGTPDTALKNVYRISGFDGEAGESDISNLASDAKEFMQGLQDFGNVTIECHPDLADAGQSALRTAKSAGTTKTFKITFANGWNITFAAFVKNNPMNMGVDQPFDGSFGLRVTGAVTLATS